MHVVQLLATTNLLSTSVLCQLTAEEICGNLGVLTLTSQELSLVKDKSAVRMCADHPLGRNRTLDVNAGASLAPWSSEQAKGKEISTPAPRRILQDRACELAAPYGCADGYCWKTCGAVGRGYWCWTATNYGTGAWNKCKAWYHCSPDNDAGYGCGRNCKIPFVCGCGC